MDSSAPFSLFSSLRVVGDMNGRTFISPLRVPLVTTHPTAFSPLSEQQPAEIRPTSIEVAWPVTAGLGVRVLNKRLTVMTLCKNELKNSVTKTVWWVLANAD
ncbi:hypothetical protein AVEN_36736-1 [Araneus ventricosus]|uniref:Uncharacterized protein n=1 Tax=Araneus ventricosus TaxID=182803 RepID=A0A4Y2MPN1_ARAVE|nr:hypothetical protein AVEN_36736-1 [Araneus ventricosus]